MEVSGQLKFRPLFPRDKSLQYPSDRRMGIIRFMVFWLVRVCSDVVVYNVSKGFAASIFRVSIYVVTTQEAVP
jgi:hypothetical protein